MKKPLVPGSFAAWGRTFGRNSTFCLKKQFVLGSFAAWGRTCSQRTDFQEFWGSCAQNRTSEISKNGLSGILGLLCAEQNVVHLKQCTFRISGTPARRNRTSGISKTCAFRNSSNQNKLHCRGQNLFSEIRLFFEQASCPGQLRCLGQNFSSKNGLSGILGLLCEEQNVGNLKKWTFRISGTPVRRTRRRK